MDSSMISKIQKAKQYAEEPERVTFEHFNVTFRGDHDTHTVTYDRGSGWSCTCHYFASRGVCSHSMALERILRGMVERVGAIASSPQMADESA